MTFFPAGQSPDFVQFARWEDGSWAGTEVVPRSGFRLEVYLSDANFGMTRSLGFLEAGVMRVQAPRRAWRPELIEDEIYRKWAWVFSATLPAWHSVRGLLPRLEVDEGELLYDFELCGLLGQLHPIWCMDPDYSDWVSTIPR